MLPSFEGERFVFGAGCCTRAESLFDGVGSFHERVSRFFNGCIGFGASPFGGFSGRSAVGAVGGPGERLFEGSVLFLALTAAARRGREDLKVVLVPTCMLRESGLRDMGGSEGATRKVYI